jgi:DNA gyrase subunit A
MARLAQDFSMRYMLVDGQGNFGSIDGDAPAAMRYTEARLAPIAMEILNDIEKETVDWTDNFDGTLKEPTVLPAKLPNLLVNGSAGIAVGMATNIPPHNLGEVVDALVYLLDHWDEQDEITVEQLMKFIPGPDFPTGGLILGREAIVQAYATGRGQLTMRAIANIEEIKGGRYRIVITEIPYQLNKSSLLERIAELVRDGKLDEISDLRDESDKRGMSIIIELKRGAQPHKALNRLYKYTPLQSTFGMQLLALVQGEPRLLPLKRSLLIFLEHRLDVIARRARFDLEKARARAHILEGLLIALDHLNAIIKTIREAADVDTARKALMEKFKLTEIQAQAILDMQLRRLTALERQKLVDEYEALLKEINALEELLASPVRQRTLIREELKALKKTYADPRRTRIIAEAAGSFEEEDVVHEERVLIPITQKGYIKRVPADTYKAQGRGGRGVTGMTTRDEDAVLYFFSATTLETLLFFTDKGKVYQEKVFQIPAADRTAKGSLLAGIINLSNDERVTAVVSVREFDESHFLAMATRQGRIKRMALSEITATRGGVLAIKLDNRDELGWVQVTTGNQELLLVTEQGQGIRFQEEDARPMGRAAAGVVAMELQAGDAVTSMVVVEPEGELFTVSALGYGRRIPVSEVSQQRRGGKGIRVFPISKRTGPVVAARMVQSKDELTIMSQNGIVLRTKVADIPQTKRTAQGSALMNLQAGDLVASVARLGNGE